MSEARPQFPQEDLIAAVINKLVRPAEENFVWEKFSENRSQGYRRDLTLISERLASIFEKVVRHELEFDVQSGDRFPQPELKNTYSNLWSAFKDWIRENKPNSSEYLIQITKKCLPVRDDFSEAKRTQLMNAVFRRLKLSLAQNNAEPDHYVSDGDELILIQQHRDKVAEICKTYAHSMKAGIAVRLDKDAYYEGLEKPPAEIISLIESLGKHYAHWLKRMPQASGELVFDELNKISFSLAGQPSSPLEKTWQPPAPPGNEKKETPLAHETALSEAGPAPATKNRHDLVEPKASPPGSGARRSTQNPGIVFQQPPPAAAPPPAALPDAAGKGSAGEMKKPEPPKPAPSPPVAPPQWKHLPVEGDLDRHEESHCKPGVSPEGLKLIGARVRGKKHKHEGTNCDDWFEFGSSGPWTIIAVSDGAGSKKLSRLGAKISCETAVEKLKADLKRHQLAKREKWDQNTLKRHEHTGTFVEADLEFVQDALHKAMKAAYDAIWLANQERHKPPYYEQYLKYLGNRPPDINDFSATLLLAVHTMVRHKDADFSFVLACQVGDGMIAALDAGGGLQLLSAPDSGAFSGETDFLTNAKKIEPQNLSRKTFGFFRPLRALMAMTDGVADDYFPVETGMLRLHADLMLNQILPVARPEDKVLAEVLKVTNLSSLDAVIRSKLFAHSESMLNEQRKPTRIRSLSHFAEKLGKPPEKVWISEPLLYAGAQGEPISDGDLQPQEKLLLWLDSYQVKGSFDDRTLVVLYRDEGS